MNSRALPLLGVPFAGLLQEQLLDEIEHQWRRAGRAPLCAPDRRRNVAPIVLADWVPVGDVRPVDREAGDHFFERRDQAVEGEVAEMPVALREAVQLVAERIDVARHRRVHHQLLAAVGELVERQPLAAPVQESRVDRRRARARGAGRRTGRSPGPRTRSRSCREPPSRAAARPAPRIFSTTRKKARSCGVAVQRFGGARLQPAQVIAGRVQSVDVIDAQSGRRAPADQLEHEAVHLVEHRRVFHAQRRQLVDVEEPAVVDLLGGHPPVREAIRLRVEQRVEPDRSCAARLRCR